jgi:hypothetical protein
MSHKRKHTKITFEKEKNLTNNATRKQRRSGTKKALGQHLSVYLLHATQRGRKQRMGGEGKRKEGQKETGKEGEEKTTYISPHAMHTLAWLTTCSVNQLIPAIVDKKRAKKVPPPCVGDVR